MTNQFSVVPFALLLLLYLLAYFLYTVPMYLLAKKMGDDEAWFAFIPILNIWQQIQLAGLDWWFILLCLIPCVNLFVIIYIWMKICEVNGKPSLLGLLSVVPLANIGLILYLAYS